MDRPLVVAKKLVIGASGFLGSHVTRQLATAGEDVRVMLRRTSSTAGIDDLDVERCYGDVFDDAALCAAMAGYDVVYYCVVDARMWLRDPAPLFRTNVEGLRHVLDAALDADLKKFVYTCTAGALAISDHRPVTEEDPHNWDQGGAYIEARLAGENLLLSYARDKGLPGVAMCISTTYGPGTGPRHRTVRCSPWSPRAASRSISITRPKWWASKTLPAQCFAAERGRDGERYIVSDRYMSVRELHEIAATAVGRRSPRIGIPMSALRAGARVNDAAARLLGRDLPFAHAGIRMAELMSPLDHSKATRELGWTPEPVEESIRKAAVWFASR